MPTVTCLNPDCSADFYSKHSTAKYCTRRCAGTHSMRRPDVMERQRMRMRKYTDEDLISRLVARAMELGRAPTCRDMRRPCHSTYADRFGSFNAAIILAGLEPNRTLPREYLEKDRHTVPLSRRYDVLRRDGFRCQYCGGTPRGGYVLHVDHKVPRSKGGTNAMSNLVTACSLCNFGKSDSLPAAVAQLEEAHRPST